MSEHSGPLPNNLESAIQRLTGDAAEFKKAATELSDLIVAFETRLAKTAGLSRFELWFPNPDEPKNPDAQLGLLLSRSADGWRVAYCYGGAAMGATWEELRDADVMTKLAALQLFPVFMDELREELRRRTGRIREVLRAKKAHLDGKEGA